MTCDNCLKDDPTVEENPWPRRGNDPQVLVRLCLSCARLTINLAVPYERALKRNGGPNAA